MTFNRSETPRWKAAAAAPMWQWCEITCCLGTDVTRCVRAGLAKSFLCQVKYQLLFSICAGNWTATYLLRSFWLLNVIFSERYESCICSNRPPLYIMILLLIIHSMWWLLFFLHIVAFQSASCVANEWARQRHARPWNEGHLSERMLLTRIWTVAFISADSV